MTLFLISFEMTQICPQSSHLSSVQKMNPRTLYKSLLNLSTKLWILSKIQGNKGGNKPELKFLINYLPLSKNFLSGNSYRFYPFSQLQLVFYISAPNNRQAVCTTTNKTKEIPQHQISKKNRNLYLIYHCLTYTPF